MRTNDDRLHAATESGGLGFCGLALPTLLPADYHGPLVVAVDWNVVIDIRTHLRSLLDDEELSADVVSDVGYVRELEGLVDLVSIWMLRDVRFVVTPRTRTDARHVTSRFVENVAAVVDAFADSLAFQFEDWNAAPPSHWQTLPQLGTETGLPHGADRDLVLEAQAVGAHVFLTRDRRLLRRTALSGPRVVVTGPRDLTDQLVQFGVSPMFGGVCGERSCVYRDHALPAPDMGKWTGLFSLMD